MAAVLLGPCRTPGAIQGGNPYMLREPEGFGRIWFTREEAGASCSLAGPSDPTALGKEDKRDERQSIIGFR
jgi:hypothetical protein